MANFFGGFIKRIEKPQDTHPRLLYRTFLSMKMNTLHTASNRKRPSANWNRGYIPTMTPEKLRRRHLQQRVHFMTQIGRALLRLTWNLTFGQPDGGTISTHL